MSLERKQMLIGMGKINISIKSQCLSNVRFLKFIEIGYYFQIIFFQMRKKLNQIVKKLQLEDYQIGRIVGKGAYGKVRIVKNKNTGRYAALKQLSKAEIIQGHHIDHVYNENFIHSQLIHPFIVHFEGLAQDSKHLYLVMELVNGGQLFTYLRSVQSFSTDQVKFYAATVACCLQYLHSKDIVYRDLKPQNLLIGKDGYLKLTDFGFSKLLVQGRTYTICGTSEYIAPQIILNQGHGKSVDWWGLGILIYQMHAGIDPFNDEDPMGIYKNILRGKVNFHSTFEKDVKSVVKNLLVADLSKRYGNLKNGVKDIKQHRLFCTFNWEDLQNKKLRPSYVPIVKTEGDVSHFDKYPESATEGKDIISTADPFLAW